MIYALKQCGTSRPSALVRRTDLPNARFPARLDSAESDTTPCGAVVGEKATQNGDAARLVVPRKCSGADAASGRGVRTLRTLHKPHWTLDTQRTRACWTDSCTVSIEPHLQKALSADDRTPRMAFSRNGSFANAIMAARGEACVEKILNVRLCAGRLVLRQRVVAYAGIEHNHASSRVCTPCPVRVPSGKLLHVDGIPAFLVNLQLGVNDSLWKIRFFS